MIWEPLAELREKNIVFDQAKAMAISLGKPLLNAGCGQFFGKGLEQSDVNLDVIPRDVPRFVLGSVADMSMFADKQFGAVFCAHVLEHVRDMEKAKSELARVADYQYIITPSPLFLTNWVYPYHQRIFADTRGGDVMVEFPPKPWLT